MDLSTLVDADDAVVADLLVGSLDLLLEAGGWFDPRIRLVSRDGDLCILSPGTDGEPLLRVPDEAWVRVDRFGWVVEDDHLYVGDVPDDAGDVELQMAYVQAALHNQCGKLTWLNRTHPSLADLRPPLIDAVRTVVPSFRLSPLEASDVLWGNRCFRMALDDDHGPERVLTPVVDLLNHRRGGATGSLQGDAFAVDTRHPFGDDECGLDYGLDRDAMEMAVVYGFADDSTAVAHSAPVSVQVSTVGTVRILGNGRTSSGATTPITSSPTDDGVEISHLSFRADRPDSTATALADATGWTSDRAQAVAQGIATANLRLLDQVITAAGNAPTPAERTLADAAQYQRGLLDDVTRLGTRD